MLGKSGNGKRKRQKLSVEHDKSTAGINGFTIWQFCKFKPNISTIDNIVFNKHDHKLQKKILQYVDLKQTILLSEIFSLSQELLWRIAFFSTSEEQRHTMRMMD